MKVDDDSMRLLLNSYISYRNIGYDNMTMWQKGYYKCICDVMEQIVGMISTGVPGEIDYGTKEVEEHSE